MSEAKALITANGGTIELQGSEQFVKHNLDVFKSGSLLEKRDELVLDKGLEHTWNWFSLHATQRLQGVYFFLLAAAFLSAAYVNAVHYELYGIATGIGVLGSVFSASFFMLEMRIRELLKKGEDSLKIAQRHLAAATGIESFAISDAVESPKYKSTSYSKVFRRLYFAATVGSLSGAVLAGYLRLHPVHESRTADSAFMFAYRCGLVFAGLVCVYLGVTLTRVDEQAARKVFRRSIAVALVAGGLSLLVITAIRSLP